MWSATAAATADMAPPAFSFEQLRSSVQILGANKVLDVLVDEVQNGDMPDITLDVVAVMILAVRHKGGSPAEDNGAEDGAGQR